MGQNSSTICHFASGDLWAGAEVQVFHLIKGLAASGNFKPCAILLNQGTLADKLAENSIPALVIDEQLSSIWTIRSRARDFIRSQNVNLLHSHRYKENIIAASISSTPPLRALVQTVHGIPEPQSGLRKAKMTVYQQLNRAFSKARFDAVVAVSEEIRSKLAGIYSETVLSSIPNGIKLPNALSGNERSSARKALAVNDNAFVFAAVGRMVPVKGFDMLLQAWSALQSNAELELILAGDGAELELLKKLSEDLSLSNVRFLGYQHDIRKVFAACDALVISSHHEGIPLTLLEAMALEIPVVATEVGGIVEVATDDEDALLVAPGNPERLGAAMLRLIEDADLRRRLGSAARARVEGAFNINKIVNKYEMLYTNLLA